MSFAPWIKIEITTSDKPEVIAIATTLKVRDSDTVTGKLVRLWSWADANSVDGTGMTITRAWIDRFVGCKGFAAAMTSVGWLSGEDGNLSFANFDRHNGDSAKKRAMESRKKSKQRAGQKTVDERDNEPAETGTNVPVPSGQTGGPEEEIEIDSKVSESARAGAPGDLPIQIVTHYPRREKFASALEIVARHLKDGEDPEAMLAGTKAIAAVIRALPSGASNRFVPSAESFFRDKRWKDDPEAFRRDAAPANGRGPASISDDAVAEALGGRA